MKNRGMLRASRLGVGLLAMVLFMLGVPDSSQAAPGDLDPTFGSGGKVITDFGGADAASALLLQPDGKIVAAGTGGSGDFALARYNPDGSLDATFGNGGKVTTDFGGSADAARAVVVQPDGKIVVVGFPSVLTSNNDFTLGRYTLMVASTRLSGPGER